MGNISIGFSWGFTRDVHGFSIIYIYILMGFYWDL
jgi:hypothetical protein